MGPAVLDPELDNTVRGVLPFSGSWGVKELPTWELLRPMGVYACVLALLLDVGEEGI